MRSAFLFPLLLLPILGGCGSESTRVARLGVEPPTVALGYPGAAELRLTWELVAPLPGSSDSPLVFVHLLSDEGEVLRTFDHPFPGSWEVGQPYAYPLTLWQSALNPALPAGSYRLSLGLYQRDGRRWPLDVAGEEVDKMEYVIARVETAPPGPGPELYFSDSWHPASPAGDQQNLTARWLGKEGTIELRGLSGEVRLAFTVGIQRLPESEHRLLLDEGEEAPAVVIASDCPPTTTRLQGFGSHDVELRLVPAEGQGQCSIALDPNYVHLDLATFRQTSLVLERLYWTANGG